MLDIMCNILLDRKWDLRQMESTVKRCVTGDGTNPTIGQELNVHSDYTTTSRNVKRKMERTCIQFYVVHNDSGVLTDK